jgi:hypothetical protein
MSQPSKPVVYIASAYTKGDVAINTRFQMEVFDRLMDEGKVWPFVPLWSHFQHLVFPRQYQDWIDYDLALLPRFDACLRMKAVHPPLEYGQWVSSGADGEVAAFRRMGKPAFFSVEDLYEWVDTREATAERTQEARARLLKKLEADGHFIELEHGRHFDCAGQHGALSAWELRQIADEMDRRNEAWNQMVAAATESEGNDAGSE